MTSIKLITGTAGAALASVALLFASGVYPRHNQTIDHTPWFVYQQKTPERVTQFWNYADADGKMRGVRVDCLTRYGKAKQTVAELLADVLPGGRANLAKDLMKQNADPEDGACTVQKRDWFFAVATDGHLMKINNH